MARSDSPLRDRMLFLVGARRSGTNWLHRILAAHPGVVALPAETHLFSHGVQPLAERIQHTAPGLARTGFAYMERDALLDALREFCDRLFGDLALALGGGGSELILERTPLHALHLDLVGAVYPDARVLHIVRDGRDVARSLVAQPWGPETVAEAAREWRECVTAARTAGARLERYREVRYEALLADPGARVPELLAWLDLEAGAGEVERALAEAGVAYNVDPGAAEVASGKWRAAFSAADERAFAAEAGGLLAELGYAEERAPAAPGRSRRRRRLPRVRGRSRGGALGREALRIIDANQVVFDAFVSGLRTGAAERLPELMTADAEVRVVDGERESSARGAAGLALLRGDPALGAPEVRGDVHPGVDRFVLVSLHELAGGERARRTLVVAFRGGAVSAVTCYR